MPSNEALELVESVLTSVSESERWQYRHADLINKKQADLDKKIENEKKKVEYYGKDPSKLEELKSNKYSIPYVKNDELREFRTGTHYNKEKLNLRKDQDQREARNRGVELKNAETNYNLFVDRSRFTNAELDPKTKALHTRIDKRTKAFDTTAKHEAACILIEALNTLINE
jgi:hypothetical protein